MRTVALITLLVALAGCVAPAAEDPAPVDPAANAPAAEPVTSEFSGFMAASPLAPPAHQAATEMLVAPVQREGFVYEIEEVPESFRVELAWSSPSPAAEMVVMVTVPSPDGAAVYDFFVGGTDPVLCMMLPVADLAPGGMAVMAHSFNAVAVDYTFRITTVGGAGTLHADRGHMEVERPGAEARESLPCE